MKQTPFMGTECNQSPCILIFLAICSINECRFMHTSCKSRTKTRFSPSFVEHALNVDDFLSQFWNNCTAKCGTIPFDMYTLHAYTYIYMCHREFLLPFFIGVWDNIAIAHEKVGNRITITDTAVEREPKSWRKTLFHKQLKLSLFNQLNGAVD